MRQNEKKSVLGDDLRLDGGPVGFLLIHGLGGTPVELRFAAQGLNRAGFTVLCPLLKGHGGSDLLLNATTWHDWYASVEAAHDELLKTCKTVVVGGLSAGALLALLLAARRPDTVHASVLFSPTVWPNGWAIPWTFRLFRLVQQKWFANLFTLQECAPYGIKDERVRRFVLESLQSDGRDMRDIFGRKGGTILEFKRLGNETKRVLGAVKQPSLIFHPRDDDQSDLSNTLMLQRKLGGRVETVVLEDSYHMVTLDRQRHVVVDRTVEFGGRIAAELAGVKPQPAATQLETG